MITAELSIIALLLLLNAFFALSEMAIVSASKPMLRQHAKQGNKRAQLALILAEDTGRFLSTVQVGITLVSTLAGAYGGAAIAEKIAPQLNALPLISPHGELVSMVVVVALITYLSVVIGELIPKQIALSNPEKLATMVAPIMHMVAVAFAPFVKLLDASASCFFRLLGIRHESEQVTEAEVKAVIAEGAASGVLEQTEYEMLQRIIRLSDRDLKSIMTPRINTTFIDVDDDLDTIRQKINDSGHSRYPVIDGDHAHILGVIQTKELLNAVFADTTQFVLRDHIKDIPFLSEHTQCLDALEMFKQSSVHIAAVVDEYGAAVGIVTAADFLESIVGMMPSNYGTQDETLIVEREDGSWLVDGTTPIDEIHLEIGLEEIDTDSDFDTIAGFVLYSLRRPPKTGDVFVAHGHRFEVVDLDGHRIDKILISKQSA